MSESFILESKAERACFVGNRPEEWRVLSIFYNLKHMPVCIPCFTASQVSFHHALWLLAPAGSRWCFRTGLVRDRVSQTHGGGRLAVREGWEASWLGICCCGFSTCLRGMERTSWLPTWQGGRKRKSLVPRDKESSQARALVLADSLLLVPLGHPNISKLGGECQASWEREHSPGLFW